MRAGEEGAHICHKHNFYTRWAKRDFDSSKKPAVRALFMETTQITIPLKKTIFAKNIFQQTCSIYARQAPLLNYCIYMHIPKYCFTSKIWSSACCCSPSFLRMHRAWGEKIRYFPKVDINWSSKLHNVHDVWATNSKHQNQREGRSESSTLS